MTQARRYKMGDVDDLQSFYRLTQDVKSATGKDVFHFPKKLETTAEEKEVGTSQEVANIGVFLLSDMMLFSKQCIASYNTW